MTTYTAESTATIAAQLWQELVSGDSTEEELATWVGTLDKLKHPPWDLLNEIADGNYSKLIRHTALEEITFC